MVVVIVTFTNLIRFGHSTGKHIIKLLKLHLLLLTKGSAWKCWGVRRFDEVTDRIGCTVGRIGLGHSELYGEPVEHVCDALGGRLP